MGRDGRCSRGKSLPGNKLGTSSFDGNMEQPGNQGGALFNFFFATIKNLGTKEEFFFNFGACSMKCDNLGENNAVKEFGEIEGTTCEPFFSAFGTNHSNAVT